METLKAQWDEGHEGEVYYFRDEQGLEVDVVSSPHAGEIELVECKSSSTVTPDMTVPMRRLAEIFRRDGLTVSMRLVYNPVDGVQNVATVGADVQALSLRQMFLDAHV